MSVCVNVSGTAFSLLLYENVRNAYDQEGFLFGEVVRNEKRTITDNEQELVSIEYTINVNSVLPCPRLGYFYDNAGKINTEKIAKLLGDKHDRVVSWYKFKRISSFKPTLREKIVMKQLATYFMPCSPQHFTWCLLTARAGDEDKKHIFSQTFIRYHMSAYQPLPMHITNLKDPHDVYKEPAIASNTFAQIVRKLPQRSQGYATIAAIETALDERTAATVAALEAAEKEMHQLEAEVRNLRKKFIEENYVKAAATLKTEKGNMIVDDTPTTNTPNQRSLRLSESSTNIANIDLREDMENSRNNQVLIKNIGDSTKGNVSGSTRNASRPC